MEHSLDRRVWLQRRQAVRPKWLADRIAELSGSNSSNTSVTARIATPV